MLFNEYMKAIKPCFACPSNERFISEIFTALCGGILPDEIVDSSAYRKRLFSGKQALSDDIKSFVIKNKNSYTFIEYCEVNVSAAKFISLCDKFNFNADTKREIVFGKLFDHLLEFARIEDNNANIETKPSCDYDFTHTEISFIGLGKAGCEAVEAVSKKWDHKKQQLPFAYYYWLAPTPKAFDLKMFKKTVNEFRIAFLVVSPLDSEFDDLLNSLLDVLNRFKIIVLLIFVDDDAEALLKAIREGAHTDKAKRSSSYAIYNKNNPFFSMSVGEFLYKIAYCITIPICSNVYTTALDFRDFELFYRNGSQLRIGFGTGSGKSRAIDAYTMAAERSLTHVEAFRADAGLIGFLTSVYASVDEVNEAVEIFFQQVTEYVLFYCTISKQLGDNMEVIAISAMNEFDESAPTLP